MHTGQSSIAPESSLPQVGQVRWGSVLMVLTVLQPICAESNTTLHGVMRKRPAQPNCCSGPQTIACSFILARQTRFGTQFLPFVSCGPRVDYELRRWAVRN